MNDVFGGDRLQRAVGRVALTVQQAPTGTVIQDLAQAGNLRACFPRLRDGTMEAVILNTAGGIADGDRLHVDAAAGQGTRLTLSTSAAERVYRARPGASASRVTTLLRVAAGARVDYLPQETILFDGCALDRNLTVDLHPQAVCLALDALVFGRQNAGERLTQVRVRDTVRLHRGGDLTLHDAIRLRGPPDAVAAARGASAVATVLYASPAAASRLDEVRHALQGTPGEAGASAWNGLLLVRMLAQDAHDLRTAVVAVLSVLREKDLPRVWSS